MLQRPVIACSPFTRDGEKALEPVLPGPGGILWDLLHGRTKASPEDFRSAFDRRCLRHAGGLSGRRVLVLGKQTRLILNLPYLLAEPMVVDNVTFRQLPMPSAKSAWYKDEVQAELAAMVMEDLYMGWVNSLGE